ncbi:MAG: prolipoprotein diacylglyceryl transferase [Haloplasmataceae bacterium]|jgi:phosphatidylglycerol:prolipoprotein diacylglycerol transferase|nr:prolipoprotein diacylglyceryl transferase [Haloplasmataceae bacterium]
MNHYELEPYSNFMIELGPIKIAYYAVFILTGALIALLLGIREGKRIGVPKPFLEDLLLYGLPISIIGARLWYVAFEWGYFKNNLGQIIRIDQGGLAIHGAVVFAVIYGYFFCKKRGVNFLKAVDLAAPGFLVAQALGRWGNFMNQEAHGGLVPGATLDAQREFLKDLFIPDFIVNQMFIKNAEQGTGYYHPTFLYESLWNMIGFGLILFLRRTKKLYVGDLGLIYLIWYSTGRYFIEGMRTDSLYIGNTGLRTAQITSIVLFLIGAITLTVRHIKKIYPKYYYEFIEENNVVNDVAEVENKGEEINADQQKNNNDTI